MKNSFYSTLIESNYVDSKIFSLTRIILLANLISHKRDGVSFRELKAGLDINDGILHFNLKELLKLGYIQEEPVTYEGKKITSYSITDIGIIEWHKTRRWLCKFLDCLEDI